MATRTNERGVLEWISDDHARGLAAEDVAHAEALMRRHETYGYLSPRDQDKLRACMDSAESLLRQTGDYKERPTDIPRPWRSPENGSSTTHFNADDDEPQPAKLTKEEARERAQAVWNVYKKITRPAFETKAGNGTRVSESGAERKVSVRLVDRAAGTYVVEGLGPRLELASYQLADGEAKRRLGLEIG